MMSWLYIAFSIHKRERETKGKDHFLSLLVSEREKCILYQVIYTNERETNQRRVLTFLALVDNCL